MQFTSGSKAPKNTIVLKAIHTFNKQTYVKFSTAHGMVTNGHHQQVYQRD